VRRHRRLMQTKGRSCDGKLPHPTKDAAEDEVRRLIARGGSRRIAAYRCKWCGGWHIGHTPRGKR
jgi:hypothetical protein